MDWMDAQCNCRTAQNNDGAAIRDSAWKDDLTQDGCRDQTGLIGI